MKISVVIPTWRRPKKLELALTKLQACQPAPDEILVHIDAGDDATAPMVRARFPSVKILQSQSRVGPGGGRNKLIEAAKNEWVVSFDDDSWPVDLCFFEQASNILRQFDGDLIACQITESGEMDSTHKDSVTGPATSFVGCGCIVRRSAFLRTVGYVPLRYAYGMEENDVAIKLINQGSTIHFDSRLHVYHDCDRDLHHAHFGINAAHISNTILFAFLRYPIRYWPVGLLQMLNRIRYSVSKGRFRGICWGILRTPWICWKYRSFREPVSSTTVDKFRNMSQ